MNRTTTGPFRALRLARFVGFLIACSIWWSGAGEVSAADMKMAQAIYCERTAVHRFRDVGSEKSWDVNDKLTDSSLTFRWHPGASEGAVFVVNGDQAELVAVTDNSVVAVYGSSDPVTAKRWLYAINFKLENAVGVSVESNAASLKGRTTEFSCDFEELQ